MSKPTIKTRFCPSPTGLLHLGNVRTALFDALLAKGQQGAFLLRIEDTDKTRSEPRYVEALQEDLLWLGLNWDEGPGHDKGAGPYWQSERQAVYDHYYLELEQQGAVYPCFCSEEQLAVARKLQRAAGKPPRYPGTCRALSVESIQEKLARGLKPTLRFRVAQHAETVFHDLVRGEQRFSNNDIGDFIVRRADGTPPFMYCNAIDDALMGVTHALRGEDHLTNTPRQLMILTALNLPIPAYGHISLIMGPDGTPLSKRHGSRSIQTLRQEGYLPLAIVNYLARLGHFYTQDTLMSMDELAAHFSIAALGSAPARFDANQLLRWQSVAVAQQDMHTFYTWMGEQAQQITPKNKRDLFIKTIQPNVTFPADVLHWAQILFSDDWDYQPTEREVLQAAGEEFFAVAIKAVEGADFSYAQVTSVLKESLGVKGKMLFQPLRVALTGEAHGPELAQVFELLGREGSLMRLHKAKNI
jgi:glutamyl-tRNA synthetase